jgi:site-specific DNA-cytosine methylase
VTIGSLFAGIGAFDLGFQQAGFETVWQVEIEAVPVAKWIADRTAKLLALQGKMTEKREE